MNSDFSELLQLFSDNGVEYLIIGSIATVTLSGIEHDYLDVWIGEAPQNAERAFRTLQDFGALPNGITSIDFTEGCVLLIKAKPFWVKTAAPITGISFTEAWPNRVSSDFGGIRHWMISREDLIRVKRTSRRPQGLPDADNLEEDFPRS